ncbi:hypothetical protein NONO_c59930 [Nocardia nova SH22a]|uniref:PE-PPE domain-containing protein n=1 Tax=Nocardia nova SH22a TaxID=1415166 RepID=W5TNN0_9NOCA|nr:hypothetical protein [Nocardia nova]AHH20769.1 hypothetical protein NONO_c59930 [Nocardia nova SH22a]
MIDVFMLPGTGFPHGGDGLCEGFIARLDPKRFRGHVVDYPAAVGGLLMPYRQSRTDGRKALIDAIRATSNLALIGGFSQGAGIAMDLAADIGSGLLPDLEIVGCAAIADPARPAGGGLPGQEPTGGFGITGERAVPGVPAWWAAHPGDPITALPGGSPIRAIADAVEYYSLASPVAMAQWGDDLIDRIRHNRWQRWWSIQNWRDWSDALGFANNYLVGGFHGPRYFTDGYIDALAAAVNDSVS